MTRTGKAILQESELYELRARMIEMDAELTALRRDHDALEALVDRIVAVLRADHDESSVQLEQVGQETIDAITP